MSTNAYPWPVPPSSDIYTRLKIPLLDDPDHSIRPGHGSSAPRITGFSIPEGQPAYVYECGRPTIIKYDDIMSMLQLTLNGLYNIVERQKSDDQHMFTARQDLMAFMVVRVFEKLQEVGLQEEGFPYAVTVEFLQGRGKHLIKAWQNAFGGEKLKKSLRRRIVEDQDMAWTDDTWHVDRDNVALRLPIEELKSRMEIEVAMSALLQDAEVGWFRGEFDPAGMMVAIGVRHLERMGWVKRKVVGAIAAEAADEKMKVVREMWAQASSGVQEGEDGDENTSRFKETNMVGDEEVRRDDAKDGELYRSDPEDDGSVDNESAASNDPVNEV